VPVRKPVSRCDSRAFAAKSSSKTLGIADYCSFSKEVPVRPPSLVALGLIKRGLLLFWAAWLSVVTATNVCDALKELGLLGASWQFVSGNFRFLTETTARYHLPPWLNAGLFLGVTAWEGAAAGLFWLAWWETCHVGASVRDSHSRLGATPPRDVTGQRAANDAPHLYPAFLAGLMLWAAFLLADELLIAYAVEAIHLRLFVAQLATLLAIVLLPEPERSPSIEA
jgi:hypothetical protein